VDANAIIEDYVNTVGAKLPRKLRDDVGLELRTLLTEQLGSAAEEAGRPADGEMAMDLLRRFGAPDEVATRYDPAWLSAHRTRVRTAIREARHRLCRHSVGAHFASRLLVAHDIRRMVAAVGLQRARVGWFSSSSILESAAGFSAALPPTRIAIHARGRTSSSGFPSPEAGVPANRKPRSGAPQ